jgi:glycosyltransferase involved in cell wall biosynthesis
MKVGIDFRPALGSTSGFGRYTLELVKALGALGAPAARDGSGATRDAPELELFGDAFRVYPREREIRAALAAAGVADKLHRTRLPGRLLNLLALAGYDASRRLGRIDVFHYTDLVYPPVRDIPTVMTVHDVSFDVDPTFHDEGFARQLAPRFTRALSRAAAIIVPGAATADELTARYGVPRERIAIIPYGSEHVLAITPARAAAAARLARCRIATPYAIAIGTIEPRKNHARLLRAFAAVAAQIPHHLLICGSYGWRFEEFRAELARLEPAIARRVHVATDVGDPELRALLEGAQFALYPSLYEGFGFPAVEALALGVPLLASHGGSLREVLGDAALVVDPTSDDSLAEGLLAIATSPALRESLATRGRARAAELSWRSCAQRHVAVYREVSGPPR